MDDNAIGGWMGMQGSRVKVLAVEVRGSVMNAGSEKYTANGRGTHTKNQPRTENMEANENLPNSPRRSCEHVLTIWTFCVRARNAERLGRDGREDRVAVIDRFRVVVRATV